MITDNKYADRGNERDAWEMYYVAGNCLFAVATGDVGCGKTTSIRKYTTSLDADRKTVLFYQIQN